MIDNPHFMLVTKGSSKCVRTQIATYLFLSYIIIIIVANLGISFNSMMKTQHTMSKVIDRLGYFGTRQWIFTDDNVRNLLKFMSREDRKNFEFDISKVHWEKYLENYVLGFREFLLKQSPKTIPSCRRKMTMFVLNCQNSFFFLYLFIFFQSY